MLRTTVRRLGIPTYAAYLRDFSAKLAKKKSTKKLPFREISARAAARWKKLSAAQKASWATKAAAMPSKPKTALQLQRKAAKKNGAKADKVKRAPSAYMLFVKNNYAKFAHIESFKERSQALAKAYRAAQNKAQKQRRMAKVPAQQNRAGSYTDTHPHVPSSTERELGH